MVVLITATFHFILAFWFLYMAVFKYHLYPDPGWFPNSEFDYVAWDKHNHDVSLILLLALPAVGISYAAVKSFLYFPIYGEVLMLLCLTFFFGVFFIRYVVRICNYLPVLTCSHVADN